MILQIPRTALLPALAIVTLSNLWTNVQAAEAPDNGAEKSVASLSELLNVAAKPVKSEGVAPASDNKTNSMPFSVAMKHLGVPLQQGSFTLADLSKRGGPAILRLSKPEQFVTVAAVGPQYVSFYDQGAVTIVDRNALTDRYTKEAFVLALPSASAPNLKFDDPVPVVKVVSGGGEVTRKIRMTNSGSQPISLEVESTSCGCTVAALSTKTLAPGQTGTMEIKMKVGAWGKKTERVTLKTSDPLWPRAVIGFQVQVPTTVVPTPSELTIETPKGQAEDRALFVVMPSNAAVVKVTTLHPFVKATLEDIQPINEGHAQRVKISVTADAPLGSFNDNVTFELKGAEVPRISVPIKGLIQSDVDVNPHQLFLGQIAQGKSIRKTFIIQSRFGRSFGIREIKSQSPFITIKPATGIVAAAHAIEAVVLAPPQADSLVDSKITITLSDGQELSIPVVGMVVQSKVSDSTVTSLKVGDPAPDFSVRDMVGNPVKLSDFQGKKNLLLTFFPKCFTGGCAGQLASLQKERLEIANAQTEVIAVSTDGPTDQIAFATQLGLSFPLIPDVDRKLSMLYGAAEQPTDLARRMSVLIDKNGIVRFIDTDVKVQTHGTDMLAKIRELGLAAP